MSQAGSQTSRKELKIVTKQVINPNIILEDKKKLYLLYLIKQMESISEKGMLLLINELKNKSIDLGYNIIQIGNNISSPALKEDITSLLYLGYIEIDQVTKRLKVTNKGLEVLENSSIDEGFKNNLNQALNELKTKITAIEQEYMLKLRNERKMLRR
ncbi:MAG: hypothetical protein QXV69_02750 [Sulfolobaceae archaeon]